MSNQILLYTDNAVITRKVRTLLYKRGILPIKVKSLSDAQLIEVVSSSKTITDHLTQRCLEALAEHGCDGQAKNFVKKLAGLK